MPYPIHKPLFGLTDKQELVLIKRLHEGYSIAEVAQHMDTSPQAVKTLMQRALACLKAKGLPDPKPYGRGSRAELRRFVPSLS